MNNIFILKNKKLSSILELVALLCIPFFVYLQLSSHTFLFVDDNRYVTSNFYVLTGLSWDNIYWAFKTFEAEFWHPLTWISYMIDTSLFGIGPGGYLLTNLLLHLVNTCLVFIFFTRITKKKYAGLFAAMVFSLHPFQVEVVSWIAQRKTLLSAMFALLSLIFYVNYTSDTQKKRYLFYILSIICFGLGLMSKTDIVVLPIWLCLLDFWPLARFNSPMTCFDSGKAGRIKKIISEKIPFFILSFAGCVMTLLAQMRGNGIVSFSTYPAMLRLSNAACAYINYIKKFILPYGFSPFYPINMNPSIQVTLICIVILLIITLGSLGYARRSPFLLTGWFWFFFGLLPVIGIIKIGDFQMADRYMYLPILGLILILVMSARKIAGYLRLSPEVLVLIAVAYIIMLGSITNRQVSYWQNTFTLYNRAIELDDQNFFAHYTIGALFARIRRFDRAAYHFARAAEIRPDKATFWLDLGRSLVFLGKWRQAETVFKEAIRTGRRKASGYFYMATLALLQKEYKDAILYYKISYRFLCDDFFSCPYPCDSAARLYWEGIRKRIQGDVDSALILFRKSVEIDQGFGPSRFAAAYILLDRGDVSKAFKSIGIYLTKDFISKSLIQGYRCWQIAPVTKHNLNS